MDSEHILGLGDQGANRLVIPVGMLSLNTTCTGAPPLMRLPDVLDCGTNNEEYHADPFYIGLRQKTCGREVRAARGRVHERV
ncbi:hypothetical protein PF005_g20792 [Phytophthora fragariae]|uniref:Malic enzyme N-terminal domain-containing protein n=1 Tax=Phytophthora fragariae TaxID=53985 RepID=A0A6A3WRT6_9STRA|nr:hypothetical protein PF010_g23856 [Phytophthora fragariae]KAE9186593.1 hypothetical protein PF005_g20792 [Phytophthora fragariae]